MANGHGGKREIIDEAAKDGITPLEVQLRTMDYDKSDIAVTYDEARGLTPARQRRWRDLLASRVDRSAISLVVDLGCGTGRFSEILAAEFGARIIGFDPSENMIDQARLKPTTGMLEFERASAHELPLADACVDLVFMSQVYHHLPDPVAMARECRRICAPAVTFACVPRRVKSTSSFRASFRRSAPCLTPICRPAMTSVRTSSVLASSLSTMQSSPKSWPQTGRNS
jgi:ubiquinone/menaquinone biosynthesis C-methylase UbiE